MIEMDRGIIVSLTSIAGYVGAPNMVPYAASKFAVRGMMEALYMELRYIFLNITNSSLNYNMECKNRYIIQNKMLFTGKKIQSITSTQ